MRVCHRRIVASLASALVLASAVPSVRADDSTDRARIHFEVAIRRYDKKDYEGALTEFRAAYDEKRSPAILRNIALCLRALGKNAEAADTLEQMLKDGGSTLKPEVKSAAEKALRDLEPEIGTVRLRTTLRDPPGTPPVRVDVMIDGHVVPPERLSGPLRVDAGTHTFSAHAPGHADASLQIRIAPGSRDNLVGLDLAPGTVNGTVRVENVPHDASVSVDGVPIAKGGATGDIWESEMTPGTHTIVVTPSSGSPWSREINVRTGETTVVGPDGTHTEMAGGASDEGGDSGGGHGMRRKPKPHLFYAGFGVTLNTGSRTLAPGAFYERAPTSRGLVGGGVFARAGHFFGDVFALELWAEISASKASYTTNGGPKADWAVTYANLGPGMRLRSKGKIVRAYGAAALGVELELVNGNIQDFSSKPVHLKGNGASGCLLFEGGASFALGRVIVLDVGPYLTVYGPGSAKDDTTNQRYFLDSPATRGGLRFLLGIDL